MPSASDGGEAEPLTSYGPLRRRRKERRRGGEGKDKKGTPVVAKGSWATPLGCGHDYSVTTFPLHNYFYKSFLVAAATHNPSFLPSSPATRCPSPSAILLPGDWRGEDSPTLEVSHRQEGLDARMTHAKDARPVLHIRSSLIQGRLRVVVRTCEALR
ncbi:hypothetical protein E2C01_016023 [Portunus trituberculatus]|uniref:Uncharacterized protein n=1 Tax=Portunus trituberculatus TaxID=210409 RepID=A0A5B7DN01_PORTR|nr:hypothetical protein [Portunus trituberculatus]